MTPSIDFSQLDLRSALDLAIMIEEDAQLRYHELAQAFGERDQHGAAAVFREMVQNESKHRRELEARRHVLFRHAPPRLDTSLLEDAADEGIEAPQADPEVPLSAREALEVALAAEVRAYQFYAGAIPHLRDPDVRAFFEELKDEELEHQALLKRKLAELPATAR